MNQQESALEFEQVRRQQEECIHWLEQNPALHQLFFDSNADHPVQYGNNEQQYEFPLDPPRSVEQGILGRSRSNNHNAQDGSASDGADYDADNEPWMLRPLHPQELQVLYATSRCRCRDSSKLYLYLPQSLCFGNPGNDDNANDLERHAQILQQTSVVLQQRLLDVGLSGTVILTWPRDPLDNAAEPNNVDAANEWEWLPQGIYQTSMICNSIVPLDGCLYRNSLIANACIGSKAVVLNVGKLVGSGFSMAWSTSLWQTITVGPEAGGGRPVRVTPQSTMVDVGNQLTNKTETETTTADNDDEKTLQNDHPPPTTTPFRWTVLSAHAVVRDTTTIDSVYLHSHATIEGAAEVRQCVLFPTARIGHGCHVSHAYLQWHCTIQDQSHVDTALLMEASHVGPHSKVGDSILGPDVALGSGEVQSCVVGPNTAAHHQSLLIANLWCHGRGNVGYGANVGSNHTGRAPDQEAWTGEGLFWGLGAVVVYPVNLLASPYSMVAAGTKLVSQSIAMPFSLVLNNSELVPAWVWTSSPYTLARCRQKWHTRRKAVRHVHYTGWEMIHRKDVLQHVYRARAILQNLSSAKQGDTDTDVWYNENGTDRIPGLGVCKVSEKSRTRAVQAYSDCLQHSCLLGLLAWLEESLSNRCTSVSEALELLARTLHEVQTVEEDEAGGDNDDWRNNHHQPTFPRMPWTISSKETWDYQTFLLVQEFGADLNGMELLSTRLVDLQQQFATAVHKSKHRDDQRGAKVIPAYQAVHVAAEDDTTVMQVQTATQNIRERISLLETRKKMEEKNQSKDSKE